MKNFGLHNSRHKITPTTTHVKVTKDENGVDLDKRLYKNMIGSILYLTKSKHGLTLSVGFVIDIKPNPRLVILLK